MSIQKKSLINSRTATQRAIIASTRLVAPVVSNSMVASKAAAKAAPKMAAKAAPKMAAKAAAKMVASKAAAKSAAKMAAKAAPKRFN